MLLSEARCQKVEPDLRAGSSTLWFDRVQLRVRDNAHHLFCPMVSVVDISQLESAISNSRTAPKALIGNTRPPLDLAVFLCPQATINPEGQLRASS